MACQAVRSDTSLGQDEAKIRGRVSELDWAALAHAQAIVKLDGSRISHFLVEQNPSMWSQPI